LIDHQCKNEIRPDPLRRRKTEDKNEPYKLCRATQKMLPEWDGANFLRITLHAWSPAFGRHSARQFRFGIFDHPAAQRRDSILCDAPLEFTRQAFDGWMPVNIEHRNIFPGRPRPQL